MLAKQRFHLPLNDKRGVHDLAMTGDVGVGRVQLFVVERDGGKVSRPHGPAARGGKGLIRSYTQGTHHHLGQFCHPAMVSLTHLAQQAAAREDLCAGDVDRSRLDRIAGFRRTLQYLHRDPAESQFGSEQHPDRPRTHHHHIAFARLGHNAIHEFLL